jgi:RHS repeat-associated protein
VSANSAFNTYCIATFGDTLTYGDTNYTSIFNNFFNLRFGYNLSFVEFREFLDSCRKVGSPYPSGFTLCNESVFSANPPLLPNCDTLALIHRNQVAQFRYEMYLDSLTAVFNARYRKFCMSAAVHELFEMTGRDQEYHYTLYYYDQAGNLVKTVPPAGVVRISNPVTLTQVATHRSAYTLTSSSNAATHPAHTLPTQYQYNSLNAVVAQRSSDGGTQQIWYDRVGRAVISMNSKQQHETANNNWYSFTVYDNLNRIIRFGEVQKPETGDTLKATHPIFGVTPLSTTYVDFVNYSAYLWWYQKTVTSWANPASGGTANNWRCITETNYDTDLTTVPVPAFAPRFLRNRVAGSFYTPSTILSSTYLAAPLSYYHYGSLYSYDVHGNVDTLVQDFQYLLSVYTAHRFKRTVYTYDLLSGNVRSVQYQPDSLDQFAHRYFYDADNRLTNAYTSRLDNVLSDQLTLGHPLWEQDAHYNYYLHGLLARTEIGHLKVQGLDYRYTLHGWIKGVNSSSLVPSRDPGRDGIYDSEANGWPYDPNAPDVHQAVCRDVFAYSLSYYHDTLSGQAYIDYQSVASQTVAQRPDIQLFTNGTIAEGGTASSLYANVPSTPSGSSGIPTRRNSLYNGNIAQMATGLAPFMQGSTPSAQALQYRYDVLNRLVAADAYRNAQLTGSNNHWNNSAALPDYRARYRYDGNGNLQILDRNGTQDTASANMDRLVYTYYANSNRLRRVQDSVPDTNYVTDFNHQPDTNNYVYDAIGNLVRDKQAGATISWNVYGKITLVTFDDGRSVAYEYDPAGNRTGKRYVNTLGETRQTIYARDAQGNVLAVYHDLPEITPTGTHPGNGTATDQIWTQYYHTWLQTDAGGLNDLETATEIVKRLLSPYVCRDEHATSIYDFILNGQWADLWERLYGDWAECFDSCGYLYALHNLIFNTIGLEKIASEWLAGSGLAYEESEQGLKLAEHHMYGSSRIGLDRPDRRLTGEMLRRYALPWCDEHDPPFEHRWTNNYTVDSAATHITFARGSKRYELTNHLGNVLTTISDKRILVDVNANDTVDFYISDIISATDYYPFGSPMPGRQWSVYSTLDSADYRYGFNGKEADSEFNSNYDFVARIYNPQIARWLSVDPAASMYPSMAPYMAFGNNPLYYIDPGGETLRVAGSASFIRKTEAALQQIRSTEEGARLYDALHSSERTFTVREFTRNETMIEGQTNMPEGFVAGDIGFTAERNSKGQDFGKNGWAALGHEMSHAYDVMKGQVSDEVWQTPDRTVDIPMVDYNPNLPAGQQYTRGAPRTLPVDPILVDEVRAVDAENKMRAEAGLDLRTHYNTVNVNSRTVPEGNPTTVRVRTQKLVENGRGTHPDYNTDYTKIPRDR